MGKPAATSVHKHGPLVLSPGKAKQRLLSNYVNYVPYLFHCKVIFLLNLIFQKYPSD